MRRKHVKTEFCCLFEYDTRGYGRLELHNFDLLIEDFLARSGSITDKGKLKCAIKPGIWYITENPVKTNEVGMVITPGEGWKIRLYRKHEDGTFEYTRYLIHPDGNKPGTSGCIGIQKNDAKVLCERFAAILKMQKIIPVYVGSLVRK